MSKKAPSSAASATHEPRIAIPPFSDKFCQSISVCSKIDWSEEVHKRFKEVDLDAEYGAKHGMHVMTSARTKPKRHFHLHVDLNRQPPKVRNGASEQPSTAIEAILGFVGRSATSMVRASYRVPLDDLPSGGPIQAFLGIATSAGGYNLAFGGALMLIEDEQLDSVFWQLDEVETVAIGMVARISTTIHETYLTEAAQIVNDGFARIVLRKENV
jgi:hypothetical protein